MVERKSTSGGRILKGVFYDSPVQGLEYETWTISGMTDKKGEFQYRPEETITFSIGGFILGSAPGHKRVTPADLVIETGGDIKKLRNLKVTNIARFLQSLDKGGDIENNIVITDATRSVVKRYIGKIDFNQSEEAFTEDQSVKALFAELKAALRTPAQARNHLRRTLYGIKKTTDVRIPTRDGSYLLADIFLPIDEGRYPAVMSLGVFGKAFGSGCICNEKDMLAKEEAEDRYFEGNPDKSPLGGGPLPWENHETANTVDWVPRGYAVIRVDARGICKTPGREEMLSWQEAKDYYDAIEWAAKQPWSNGKVGLWGTGYYGMNAYNLAQFQPPSLKAFIPISADSESYRDHIYSGGGLWNTFSRVVKNSCGEWQGVDWVSVALAHPFCDPDIYGPTGSICLSPDLSKINVPFWSAMGLSATIHTRGASEAYIRASSKHKKLTIISETGIHHWAWAKEWLEGHMAFFDYWLKGIDNGIMKEPPVRMMVRTGRGGYYWQYENEWPIARTRCTKYYLDAAPSAWGGDGKRNDFMKLHQTVPGEERSSTYSADVAWSADSAWKYGVSFVTDPLPEDTVIAGYLKLVIWVSSTSHDMELHASVRVMDENNLEVPYPLGVFDITTGKMFPVAFGALKVSHRKLDPEKSTVYRPWHTHLKEDYQPLNPGEAVEAEVELWPTTAFIRKGWRIRLDVQPAVGNGLPTRIYDMVDQTYQRGSENTVYSGPGHPSYLQLPVILPKK
jgi:predicted acyl esterase